MRIRITEQELTESSLADICMRMEDMRNRILKLKAYYLGRHVILNKPQRSNNAPNNKVVANYCEYITDMSTGFFMGKPIAYTSASKNEEEVKALQDIFKYNDEAAHNLRLAEEASITGAAYEVLYMDEDAQIRFSAIPSEELMMVYDASLEEKVLCAIWLFRVYDPSGATYQDYADVYDKQYVTHYYYNSGQLVQIAEPELHYFDDVPVIEYLNNREERGDFEGVITLVDAYNKAQSLTLDDMEDFTDAYLVLKGMGGTTGDDVAELRRNKVLSLDEGRER